MLFHNRNISSPTRCGLLRGTHANSSLCPARWGYTMCSTEQIYIVYWHLSLCSRAKREIWYSDVSPLIYQSVRLIISTLRAICRHRQYFVAVLGPWASLCQSFSVCTFEYSTGSPKVWILFWLMMSPLLYVDSSMLKVREQYLHQRSECILNFHAK